MWRTLKDQVSAGVDRRRGPISHRRRVALLHHAAPRLRALLRARARVLHSPVCLECAVVRQRAFCRGLRSLPHLHCLQVFPVLRTRDTPIISGVSVGAACSTAQLAGRRGLPPSACFAVVYGGQPIFATCACRQSFALSHPRSAWSGLGPLRTVYPCQTKISWCRAALMDAFKL